MGPFSPGLSFPSSQGSLYACGQARWVKEERGPQYMRSPTCSSFWAWGRTQAAPSTWAGWEEGVGSWPSHLSACQGHGLRAAAPQLSEGVGEAILETAQERATGHQPPPLSAIHVSAGPRWPGGPGLPRCGPDMTTVTTTNKGSRAATSKPQQACQPQPAGPLAPVGTVPGFCVSSALSNLSTPPQAENKEFGY